MFCQEPLNSFSFFHHTFFYYAGCKERHFSVFRDGNSSIYLAYIFVRHIYVFLMLFVYTTAFVVSNHMVLDQLWKMLRGRYAILDIEHVCAFEGLSNMLEKTFCSKRRFTMISPSLDLFTLKKGIYGFIHIKT